ncbi:TonB-dependent receptor [Massilia antarctica]|uniref:TonB-dependent receptor n=1 Tax=Massilia antarctica TaxID=2765360 RepID=UPI0006BB6F77|nr:TonB-dependent receptor [Massilia sp. H27-R4]MCY0914205.1 TonB-dependent receptor [Massilia sp. H27-R4]CUI08609.1 Outer membrane receptor proteins, mostly Fe transport [Janthinobacterium sp. CG23_2]CUU32395.1 Outer membrane receptor proteins, mostly Fe transport [Janthinobacterium sp. CG23_2]
MRKPYRQYCHPLPVSRLTRAVRLALHAGAAGLLAHGAAAAQAPDAPLPKVEITGSAIKRIVTDTPLPVQVVTREEIEKAGVTTAAELMARISSNVGGLTDGASINVGGDQRGFNSANLRGIGTSSTLVLLNGRRMANFASPGDDSGVDLNNIPAAAIARVEVLLDGASALYGTDAIGGVINFITRKDFHGVEMNAYVLGTKEGGAGKRAATLSLGTGELEKDGYNVFAVLDVQGTDRLNTSQRKFVDDLRIPQRLGHLLSNYTGPANIRLTSAQRDHLQETGFLLNGRPITNRQINLSIPTCAPPANLYLPAGSGGVDACTYNYMGDTELYPESTKQNLLSRGVIKLGADAQAYAEVALSRSRTNYVGSSARVTGAIDYRKIPALANTGLDQLDDDNSGQIALRLRLSEAGMRTSELTSESQRYVLGVTGITAGWDYDAAYNHSVNTVKDKDTHGYLLRDQLLAGIADGKINPFGPSGAEGVALLGSIQVNDVVRRARGTVDSLDVKASRSLMTMAGGDLGVAVGAEARRERTDFNPSALLMSDNINNDDAPEGGKATSDQRKVYAVFGELLAPFTKQWQGQLSARYDHYQQVGGALSPKIGMAWTPGKALTVRASAGKGFRAPSMSDLYRPTVYSQTATLPDPVLCATVDNNFADCAFNWDTRRYSNANLKPERSRQFSAGLVIEPSKHWNASLDYWKIKRTDLISEIGDDIILGNLGKYGNLVHRNDDGEIDYIELHKENRGAQLASGLDLVVNMRSVNTGVGRFGARLNGTYVLDSKIQTSSGDPYISNLGKFVTDTVVQRWRHTVSMDWEQGPLSATLSNTFSASYDDQNSAINTDDGSVVAPNRVKAYSLWDMSLGYEWGKNLKLRAGVQNMFDKAPPYSNQANFFISGYDPTYTDPRGRRFYASVNYAFR